MKKRRVLVFDEAIESLPMNTCGKDAIRRILRAIHEKHPDQSMGIALFLSPQLVIDAIEQFPVSGKTMHLYFVYAVMLLKYLEKEKTPGAFKAREVLQKFHNVNYKHFAKSINAKQFSAPRKEFIDKHKGKLYGFLKEVGDLMKKETLPINLRVGSYLGKVWTRVVGFTVIALQQETGCAFAMSLSSTDILSAKCKGEFVTIKNEHGEKVVSKYIHQCLLLYLNLRSYREPLNNTLFVTITGESFTPTAFNRYEPILPKKTNKDR